MKLAIDGTAAIHDVSAIRRYAHHLLAGLAAPTASIEEGMEYILLFLGCKPWRTRIPFKKGPHLTIQKSFLPGPLLRRAWRFAGWPDTSTWLPEDCKWLHFPGGYPCIPNRKKSIITTLHGFAPQHLPDHLPSDTIRRSDQVLQEAIKGSHHFITVSERTKEELMALCPVPEERITAIPLGVSPEFKENEPPEAQAAEVRGRYGLPRKKHILFVGALAPHKNIDGIIEAYRRLDAMEQSEYQLVLVGRHGRHARSYQRRVHELGLAERVTFIDYIQPGSLDLACLYNMASIFVFPSLYEAWASPPLEAMLCGTPAIVSDIPGLRESTGGIALYCRPDEPDSLTDQVRALMHKPGLYTAQKAEGLKFASQFTWARCVQRTVQLYRELAGCS